MGAKLPVGPDRPPVLFERSKIVPRVLVRMLLPIWISVPKRIGSLVVPMLHGRKEFVDGALLTPVPEVIHQESENGGDHHTGKDVHAATLFNSRIVFFGFEYRHL